MNEKNIVEEVVMEVYEEIERTFMDYKDQSAHMIDAKEILAYGQGLMKAVKILKEKMKVAPVQQ